ncbi:MAG TPA: histidine kinase dimerization/phospho-acceptor domain-containing protein [Thermoanaerobaculia bacterium]|nr:histidine kinase dimerization/phospho-acceptor domain-containing protein [Thermoanaerobaculia bacterium]
MTRFPAGAAVLVVRLLAGAAMTQLALPAAARAAQDPPAGSVIVERPEADVLLLALRLEQSTLAEALPTYQDRGSVLVPLGEVCRLLGLGITVDVGRGFASGFFIDERRLFALDVASRTVIAEGKPKRFDPAEIEVHQDDIYVDAALLSEWLPLHLGVDLHASMITVRPDEKLPSQLRLDRESKLDRSRASQRLTASSYPKIELPYRLFDGPFVDQTLTFTRQPNPQGGSQNALQSSTYATGDVLFMEANAFVSATDHGIADSRFSLSRKDPEGTLLGVLGAREVTVGDVFHPGLALIALPNSGPGLTISNFPLQLPTQFDRQSFRGDLPPGWEVELYRGQDLLAFAQSRPDGAYEFLDVPLLFGLNLFRLEFYGPQGQHRSETRRLNVGDTLTPQGKLYYRLVGNDPSYRLLGKGVDAGARSSLDLSGGLTRNLSVTASLAAVDLADRRHTYGKAGLRAFSGFLFANVDVAVDTGGGSAWQATLQSRLGRFGLQLQHAELDHFVSEAFVSPLDPIRSRTTVRLDTTVPETLLPPISVLVEVLQDRLESSQQVSQLNGRLSASRRGLSVANQVEWAFSSGSGPGLPANASGQLLVSKFLPAFALRGELDYNLEPASELTSVAVTAETRVVPELLLSAGISRTIQGQRTRFLAGVSKLEGAFGFGVTADYSRPDGLGVILLLSVAAGRDARNAKWHPQARPIAGSGAVSGRAFLDLNGNGLMDAGEKAIPGAGFLLGGAGSLARTDDAGEAFLPNLAPYKSLDVALAPSTLEDPFWKPAQEGVRIVPRPGKTAVIDFPVVISGEIAGTVYLKKDGKSREASGVELELVDQHGVVVKRATSGYDGFYDITEIRPGGYTLSVTAEHVRRLHVMAPSREVKMVPSGTVLDGVNFILEVWEPTGDRRESTVPGSVAGASSPSIRVAPIRAGDDYLVYTLQGEKETYRSPRYTYSANRGIRYIPLRILEEPAGPQRWRAVPRPSGARSDAMASMERSLSTAQRSPVESLARVGHALRAPLNSILGFGEVLLDRRYGELNERQSRCVANILAAGDSLLRLINDTLDLARLEAGLLKLELVDFDLAPLLGDLAAVLRVGAGKKGIELAVDVEEPLAAVKADPRRLKQIVFTLLSAAVDFTPAGGQVRLLASRIPSASAAAGIALAVSGTAFRFRDEEPQPPGQALDRLELAADSGGEGVRTRLALVSGLVELHGGRIWAEQGAEGAQGTVRIDLPAATAAPPAGEAI